MNSYELERKHLENLYEIITMMADSNGVSNLGETFRDINASPLTIEMDTAYSLSFMCQWNGLMHIKRFIEGLDYISNVMIATESAYIDFKDGPTMRCDHEVDSSDGRAELLRMFAEFAKTFNESHEKKVIYYNSIATGVRAAMYDSSPLELVVGWENDDEDTGRRQINIDLVELDILTTLVDNFNMITADPYRKVGSGLEYHIDGILTFPPRMEDMMIRFISISQQRPVIVN